MKLHQGFVLSELKRIDEAEKLYLEVCAAAPDSSTMHKRAKLQLVVLYANSCNFEKAASLLSGVKGNVAAYMRGCAYFYRRDYQKAAETVSMVISHMESSTSSHAGIDGLVNPAPLSELQTVRDFSFIYLGMEKLLREQNMFLAYSYLEKGQAGNRLDSTVLRIISTAFQVSGEIDYSDTYAKKADLRFAQEQQLVDRLDAQKKSIDELMYQESDSRMTIVESAESDFLVRVSEYALFGEHFLMAPRLALESQARLALATLFKEQGQCFEDLMMAFDNNKRTLQAQQWRNSVAAHANKGMVSLSRPCVSIGVPRISEEQKQRLFGLLDDRKKMGVALRLAESALSDLQKMGQIGLEGTTVRPNAFGGMVILELDYIIPQLFNLADDTHSITLSRTKRAFPIQLSVESLLTDTIVAFCAGYRGRERSGTKICDNMTINCGEGKTLSGQILEVRPSRTVGLRVWGISDTHAHHIRYVAHNGFHDGKSAYDIQDVVSSMALLAQLVKTGF